MALNDFIERVFACSAETARQIEARARPRAYPAGSAIVRQGEPCHDVYLLVMGRARSFVISPDGLLIRFYDFAPGDLFGALSDGRDHFSEISALEDLDSAIFGGADFLALLEAHSCVGLTLSRALLRQLARISEQMLSRATLSAAGRVHEELLRLVGADGVTIAPAPVLSELAARVYTTRETVSRTVSALERRGIVRRDADALVIVAPARLADMVV
ncbi:MULTISPECIES: Crp/Fnr family transcriptional regulator [unclassified Sphingomonas]|nr:MULTISPECIES: Crp/Fnr family transcriptional regulator [unclassified Sphingomonas]